MGEFVVSFLQTPWSCTSHVAVVVVVVVEASANRLLGTSWQLWCHGSP